MNFKPPIKQHRLLSQNVSIQSGSHTLYNQEDEIEELHLPDVAP